MKSWRKSRTEAPDFHKQDLVVCPATRFFDQLSFIGDEIVGCFVLETSQGLVLIDCMNPDQRCIDIIEQGFADLGLDLHQLCAIVISHGHGDHYGRADYFKEKYGAKIYLSKIDYELVKSFPESAPWKAIDLPVDHFLVDGEELEFGDTKIKAVFTPGHSEGCFSFIIPVTDEGRPHQAALWGGSGILRSSNVDDYYDSWMKFSCICREYHVDAEIATHPCLDMGLQRLAIVRNIVDGVPNPFVIGEEGYQYYEQKFYQIVMKHKEKSSSQSH